MRPCSPAQTFDLMNAVFRTARSFFRTRCERGRSYPKNFPKHQRNSTFPTNSNIFSNPFVLGQDPCFLMIIWGLDRRDYWDFDPEKFACRASPGFLTGTELGLACPSRARRDAPGLPSRVRANIVRSLESRRSQRCQVCPHGSRALCTAWPRQFERLRPPRWTEIRRLSTSLR